MMRPRATGILVRGGLTVLLLTACGIGGCAYSSNVAEDRQLSSYSTRPYREALTGSVRDGLVNYRTLRERHGEDMDVYLDALARFGPKSTPERFPTPEAKLAYYINAYNAFMLERWLNAGAGTGDADRSVNQLWLVVDRWKLDGESVTLNDIEQNIIRADFQEPRIHFALVCGAQGCPPLLGEPFEGERLDRQLDSLARQWLREPDGLRVAENGRVSMSKIFQWYREDFQRMGGLSGVIQRYLPEDEPRTRRALEAARNDNVRFPAYDWTINSVRAASDS